MIVKDVFESLDTGVLEEGLLRIVFEQDADGKEAVCEAGGSVSGLEEQEITEVLQDVGGQA